MQWPREHLGRRRAGAPRTRGHRRRRSGEPEAEAVSDGVADAVAEEDWDGSGAGSAESLAHPEAPTSASSATVVATYLRDVRVLTDATPKNSRPRPRTNQTRLQQRNRRPGPAARPPRRICG